MIKVKADPDRELGFSPDDLIKCTNTAYDLKRIIDEWTESLKTIKSKAYFQNNFKLYDILKLLNEKLDKNEDYTSELEDLMYYYNDISYIKAFLLKFYNLDTIQS